MAMPRMKPATRLISTWVRTWVMVPRADTLPPAMAARKMPAE